MTRSVVTYVAVGFALLEAVWYVAPLIGLADAVGRVATGVVVLGFPLAVVLAWTYDLTPGGIVRTPDELAEGAPVAADGGLRRSVWLLMCAAIVAIGFVFRALRM